MLGKGEWKTKTHGADHRRQWPKVHLGINASILEIRAMEVTDNNIGDAPFLPALIDQIPAEEKIASVSGDDAYNTKNCHEAIALRAAHAIIRTRKNAKPCKANRCGADARNETLRATKGGRAIWKRWTAHYRRRLVETKIRCLKLLGERVMARDFDRQVAELQVRAAVLKRFTWSSGHGPSVIKRTTNSVSSAFA